MKRLALALAALLLPSTAHAQPPEIAPDLVAYLDSIEAETGTKRFGATLVGALEEDDEAIVVIAIPTDKDTYIQIACDDFCEAIYAYAENGKSENIDHTEGESPEPVLFIPAGTGDRVSVTVTMGYCDEYECEYAVQAFVR